MVNTSKIQKNIEEEKWYRQIDMTYALAKKVLDKERIDLNEFIGIYPESEIKEDLEYLGYLQQKFESDNVEQKRLKKMADILEVIVYERAKESKWLKGEAVLSSQYDDWVNKVDMVLEYPDEKTGKDKTNRLALAIDATFSSYVGDKLREIKDRIDKGRLGEIKYFYSKTHKGSLEKVPRVVIGVDFPLLKDLMGLWLLNQEGFSKNKEKIRHLLDQHVAQHYFIRQIREQLQIFADYAGHLSKRSDRHKEIEEIFRRDLAIIESIYQEQRSQEAIEAYEKTKERTNEFDLQFRDEIKHLFQT